MTDLSRKLHDIHRNWPIVYRRFRGSLSLKCSCFASVGLTAVLETTIFFSVHRTAHSWCMLIALRDKLIALRKFCKKYVTMESVLKIRKTKVFFAKNNIGDRFYDGRNPSGTFLISSVILKSISVFKSRRQQD